MSLSEFETDEQRAEALVDWLKANSGFLILMVVVVFGTIFGVHYYRNYKEETLRASSNVFSVLYDKDAQKEVITDADINSVVENGNQTYVTLSALLQAKQKTDANDFDAAMKILEKALETETDQSLIALLKYRLATIKFQQNDLETALSLLLEVKNKSFKAIVKSLEGDIYILQDKVDQARIAYEEALIANPSLQFTQMKLNHIGRNTIEANIK